MPAVEQVDIQALGRRAVTMIGDLAAISAEPDRLTRLYLTPEHRRAADLVTHWMREAGMTVYEDALGTVRGRLEAGVAGAPCLLVGSHIDTVPDAGAYDGALGVIAGILAVDTVRHTYGSLPFSIEVLAFGDEEGSRFPATLLCSKAVAGQFDMAALDAISIDGISLEQALLAYGKDPETISRAAFKHAGASAYIEVHIEQGPVLEQNGLPYGVVTAIAGQSRYDISVTGEAGHAGTVPMRLRHDALAASAEMVLLVETIVHRNADDFMVGTVGRMSVEPGASNVIPARVTFSLDLRSQTDNIRRAAFSMFDEGVKEIAHRRGVQVTVNHVHEAPACPCDQRLQSALAEAIRRQNGTPLYLPSGAGHDGQAMAALCPVAMLFVRCREGISHHPAEFASPQDIGQAIGVLVDFIGNFDQINLAGT